MLSSYLFGKLIDKLISKCIAAKAGALIHDINTCIIVYADDILLISPNDHQLQLLLNICGEYGETWKIKFNSKVHNHENLEIERSNEKKMCLYVNNFIIQKNEQIKLN